MHIQRFIDKVSLADSKQNKDFVMPIAEARGLRDELMKILVESHQLRAEAKAPDDTDIVVEVRGGTFK